MSPALVLRVKGAEDWGGIAIVLTAENKGPDNSPSLETSIGLI